MTEDADGVRPGRASGERGETEDTGVVASFTITRYAPLRAWRGAASMATDRPRLARTPGLRFARLLGAGAGIGFSAKPDLTAWALFCAWEDRASWEAFHDASRVMRARRDAGEETYTLLLAPRSVHGRWGGEEPFGALPARPHDPDDGDGGRPPVVVLTRAAIRPARALRFWRQVPRVDATLHGHPDLLLSFGVGEAPWLLQATLSAWRSAAAMRAWAYSAGPHREVVRRTRDEKWYAEELFARFDLLATRGRWGGADPLAAVTPDR